MVKPTVFSQNTELFHNMRMKIEKKKTLIILDSGIDVAPGITVAYPLKNFHITILIRLFRSLEYGLVLRSFRQLVEGIKGKKGCGQWGFY